jgi:glycosyltransferase involved in cell wall biosynthesis
MAPERELTVAVHAQLLPGRAGGVETNLLSLLAALDGLGSGRQIVIGPGDDARWLQRHLGPRQTLVQWQPIGAGPSLNRRRPVIRSIWSMGKALAGGARRRLSIMLGGRGRTVRRRPADLAATLVEMGVELVHFPYQRYFGTTLPTIFEPWDLQHLHYPEFFTDDELERREWIYPDGCQRAALVVAATAWSKRDFVRRLGVPADKIAVIPRGPAPDRPRVSDARAAAILERLGVSDAFAVYPAKTWAHKNHVRLFEALAVLRDRDGVSVPVVCTGGRVAHYWPQVEQAIERLSLHRTVMFTGHVDGETMTALYRRARFMVFPSLFEGLGIPVLEAMQEGLPLVISRATCLPEIAGDAALYFDPTSVESIVETIRRAWSDSSLLEDCRARGGLRAKGFSWATAAKQFDISYRHVAGRPLGAEEQAIFRTMTSDPEW